MYAAYGQLRSLAKREEESEEATILIHKGHAQQCISMPVALWETYPFGAPRSNLDAEASWVHTYINLFVFARDERKLDREALAREINLLS